LLSSTIGKFPLSNRQFPDGGLNVTVIEDLLNGAEIEFGLKEDVTYNRCAYFYNLVHCGPVFTLGWFSLALSERATLSLLYYAGYLTMTVCHFYPMVLSILISVKANNQFKILNQEVMMDWTEWIIGDIESPASRNTLKMCVEGPVSDFAKKWPNFTMQQYLHPKLVSKESNAVSCKTPERIYRVLLWGLAQHLKVKGWEVSNENRAGGGYVGICLRHRRRNMAVLIELKSSEKRDDMERDANKALKQVKEMNYRNPEGLPNIRTLREYGIAFFHLSSHVKGRYLELDGQDQWIEKDDPIMPVL
jgi:PD-(D/E)XK nuclease superfamily